eukprot:3227820-Heterocapsa_arctica.AAC.1
MDGRGLQLRRLRAELAASVEKTKMLQRAMELEMATQANAAELAETGIHLGGFQTGPAEAPPG